MAILKQANDFYTDVAKQYDREVFKKILKELFDIVLQSLFLCFDSQLKMLNQTTYQKVDSEIKKLEKKDLDEICDNLSAILTALRDSNISSFKRRADSLVIEGSGWDTKVAAHKNDLTSHIVTLTTNCKEKLLSKLTQTA